MENSLLFIFDEIWLKFIIVIFTLFQLQFKFDENEIKSQEVESLLLVNIHITIHNIMYMFVLLCIICGCVYFVILGRN